jgi:hypothetical protein
MNYDFCRLKRQKAFYGGLKMIMTEDCDKTLTDDPRCVVKIDLEAAIKREQHLHIKAATLGANPLIEINVVFRANDMGKRLRFGCTVSAPSFPAREIHLRQMIDRPLNTGGQIGCR